ncbi:9977_t:CDS:2, partial [Ambispora gerdemannii]
FGVLLWEIAEQKTPFQSIENDIVGIRQNVLENKREQFSLPLQVPVEWADIVNKATSFDSTNRPALATIFTELFDLSKKHLPHPPATRLPSNPRSLFSVQTVQDAINIHKSKGGDRKTAFKIFSEYAELGDSTAKYW